MKTPYISIIIPVYNSEKYISRLLDSILAQTYQDYEVILINDGSKDSSLKILQNYAKKDPRFKVHDQKNSGAAATRNHGIKLAKGHYIMFADNDDYFLNPEFLTTYANAASNNDIIIGGYKRINSKGKVLQKVVLKNSPWSKYIIVAPWARLYKRDFLTKNHLTFLKSPIGEDVYLNLLAYSKTTKIKTIQNTDYAWFYNDQSVSNTSQKGLQENIDILSLLDAIIKHTSPNDPYLKYYLKRYIIWYLLFSGKNSSPAVFLKHYQKYQSWQKSHHLTRTFSPLSPKLKGEGIKNRLIVLIFITIIKLHLTKLFAKFYCQK